MPRYSSAAVSNAATATALETGRTIDGQLFDGTANITVIAPGTHAANSKTTPVDADEVPGIDSAASNTLKRFTWANIKATLKTYFDSLYPSGSGASSGTNTGDQTITLTSDVTGSGTGSFATTLATVNSNVGSFGSATQAGVVTVNAKGLVTAASQSTVTPAVGSITGLGTGIATAIGVNVGTAGAPVINGGAVGTPSSGTLTNATGLPPAGVVGTAAILGANTFTAGQTISAGQVTVPNGTVGAPSFSFSSFPTYGIYFNSSTGTVFSHGGVDAFGIKSAQLALLSSTSLGWTSSNITTTVDLFVTRAGPASLKFGSANNASPVAQTLQTQGSRSGTDSNVGGANLTIESGTGTGTGTVSSLIFRSPAAVASGTGAQTMTAGLTIKNGSPIIPPYTVATLPAAATNQDGIAIATDALTTLALGLGTTVAGGGENRVGVRSDGTNWVYSF